VKKGLGKWVRGATDPRPAVQLLFEPNRDSVAERTKGIDSVEARDHNAFYASNRRNCCVVCGDEDHYVRYSVIPSMYRCVHHACNRSQPPLCLHMVEQREPCVQHHFVLCRSFSHVVLFPVCWCAAIH